MNFNQGGIMSLNNNGEINYLEEKISFYSQQAELYDQINCALVFFVLFLIILIVIMLLKLILTTKNNNCTNGDFHKSHSTNNKLKKNKSNQLRLLNHEAREY